MSQSNNNIDIYSGHLKTRLQALFRSTNKVLSEFVSSLTFTIILIVIYRQDPHKRMVDMPDLALKAEEFESICDEMYTCIEINKQNIILNNLFESPIELKQEPEDSYYRLATKTHSARETRKTIERFSKQLELNHQQLQKYLQQIREEDAIDKQRQQQEQEKQIKQQQQPSSSEDTSMQMDHHQQQQSLEQQQQQDHNNQVGGDQMDHGGDNNNNKQVDTPITASTNMVENATSSTTPSMIMEASTPTINTTDVDMTSSGGGGGDVLNVASHLFKSSTGMPQTDSPGISMYSPQNQLKSSSGGIEKQTADTPQQHLSSDTPSQQHLLFPSSPAAISKKDDDLIADPSPLKEQEIPTPPSNTSSNMEHHRQVTIDLDEEIEQSPPPNQAINVDDDDDDAEFEMVEAMGPPIDEVEAMIQHETQDQ
ncbi:hypothetical protein DFA_11508 [Cavenderia fasciculata]|uniref:Uncharacterized protein n=1 Tax=Cavenderia fasciculata TaxID=261658 RepID=F4QDB9_CACFS|nr:uncharacterized protein DFA_11508 [Cavenderia fasciculata]EGG13747.1 hypothetical protein DFA_11508 [Cavenderia fasciculata]|eukprot:XP_004350454.1 hypothetical protein DFA_11508 [Cavenderia fasciculata]